MSRFLLDLPSKESLYCQNLLTFFYLKKLHKCLLHSCIYLLSNYSMLGIAASTQWANSTIFCPIDSSYLPAAPFLLLTHRRAYHFKNIPSWLHGCDFRPLPSHEVLAHLCFCSKASRVKMRKEKGQEGTRGVGLLSLGFPTSCRRPRCEWEHPRNRSSKNAFRFVSSRT